MSAAPALAAERCTLQLVIFHPSTPEPSDRYIGRTSEVELRVSNDKSSGQVVVFPEPPLTVRRVDTRTECAIPDGGIWVRDHIWASRNGVTLATHEYSGSTDALVFYDTSTCARVARIDVSNVRWAVDGNGVSLTPPSPGTPPSRIALDASCRPLGPASSPGHR